LGTSTTIDSLKLFWISGVEDVHYNLPANTFQLFVEAETSPTIVASKSEICPVQDSVQLTISSWPVIVWEDGSVDPERTVHSSGIYSAHVSTGFGHSLLLSIEISESMQPVVTSNLVQPSCFGSSDGQIQVEWQSSSYAFTIQLNNLIAGVHSLEIPYGQGCTALVDFQLSEPTPIVISSNEQMPSAFNDGSIVLSVSGGIEPYLFEWSNGNQLAENNNLQAGNYFVSVTDGNGCSADTTFSLIFNYVNSLNLNTMNWTLHKDGLHYDGSETLHHVFVYDAVGRLLHREQIMAGHTTIPMDASGPLFILSHEGNWKSSISLE
jgi:hypothetical protein